MSLAGADGDGDLDLLFGGNSNAGFITRVYRNDAGSFVDSGVVLHDVPFGCVSWIDSDNDGDLDLLLSGNDNGSDILRLYRNNTSSGTPFCFGDGTGAVPCPCGNSGLAGHGCANSQVAGGALLMATGTTSPDVLVLTASQMLPSAASIFLQGDGVLANGAVFGDGLRCAGGQLLRLGLKSAVNGQSQYPGPGDLSISARSAGFGAPIPGGASRYYQTYYRDPSATFCPAPSGRTWNITNALHLVW